MTEELNISEILKGKSKGTKLYSLIFGDCTFSFIQGVTDAICVIANDTREFFDYKGLYSPTGECLLFPSKEMRDWSKFTWKKGDVLVNGCGFQCIFKEWASDDYTKFNGCYSNSRDGYEDVLNAETAKFDKLDNNIAYGYVREIERKLGGKFNRETLEVEKAQPEFKEGDIVCYNSLDGDKCIGIVKEIKNDAIVFHVDYNLGVDSMDFDVSVLKEYFEFYKSNDLDDEIALNEALHIRNKSWNKEKNILENLKPKVELKPFDRVLVRNSSIRKWEANLFGFKSNTGLYHCVDGTYNQCIPYEGNEHLLGTTEDVEG